MNFVFARDDDYDTTCLQQGDLIIRNEQVKRVLEQAHQYYATSPDYTHFVVLTQSCDLVRRRGSCKSRYITIAAVRPLRILVSRFLEKFRISDPLISTPLFLRSRKIEAEQFLERIIHFTEDQYFLFKSGAHPSITEDLCAFLNLSIALKAEHYEALLGAKIAQLEDVFAAKLGWLSGNLYSRVATPDVEERIPDADSYKAKFVEESLSTDAIWLSQNAVAYVKQKIKDAKKTDPYFVDTKEFILEAIESKPSDDEMIAQRAADLAYNLIKQHHEDEALRSKIKFKILNDGQIKRILTHYSK